MYSSQSNSILTIRLLFALHVILFLITSFFISILLIAFNFFTLPNNWISLFHEPDQIPFIIDFGFSEIFSLIFCISLFYVINPLLDPYLRKENSFIIQENLHSTTQFGETFTEKNYGTNEHLKEKKELHMLRAKDLIILNSLWLCGPFILIIEDLKSVFYSQTDNTNLVTGIVLIMILWAILSMLIPFRYFNKISKLIESKT